MNGTLVMRINVEPSGAVGGFEVLTNTLMVKGAEDPDDTRADAVMAAASALMDTCFPETEKGGDITLPLIFC